MLSVGVPVNQTSLWNLHTAVRVHGTNLRDSSLFCEEVHPTVSVGMICFSVDPKTNNIFLLLGKETCFENMQSPRGAWCDFGGKPRDEETAPDAAAREFCEESLACVNFECARTRPRNVKTRLAQVLKTGAFFCRIDLTALTQWTQHHNQKRNVTRTYFVKEIPWQPHVPHTFQDIRKKLCHVQSSGEVDTCPFSLRNHPSLEVQNKHVRVNNHYLEKHSIMWWSLDRLCEVLQKHGRYKNQRFRKSFLPILQIVVARLKQYYV